MTATRPTPSRYRSAALVALAMCWLAAASPASAQLFELEEPTFEVLKKSGEFELRQYQAMVVAEVPPFVPPLLRRSEILIAVE